MNDEQMNKNLAAEQEPFVNETLEDEVYELTEALHEMVIENDGASSRLSELMAEMLDEVNKLRRAKEK